MTPRHRSMVIFELLVCLMALAGDDHDIARFARFTAIWQLPLYRFGGRKPPAMVSASPASM